MKSSTDIKRVEQFYVYVKLYLQIYKLRIIFELHTYRRGIIMKWIIFRVAVCFYLRKYLKKHNYNWLFCWKYSGGFDNFFDDVKFISIVDDAEFAVSEELSYWD